MVFGGIDLTMSKDWPYCNHARQLTSVIKSTKDWDSLKFRRRLETFGRDDGPGKFSLISLFLCLY
jgi:hypothetical protein